MKFSAHASGMINFDFPDELLTEEEKEVLGKIMVHKEEWRYGAPLEESRNIYPKLENLFGRLSEQVYVSCPDCKMVFTIFLGDKDEKPFLLTEY